MQLSLFLNQNLKDILKERKMYVEGIELNLVHLPIVSKSVKVKNSKSEKTRFWLQISRQVKKTLEEAGEESWWEDPGEKETGIGQGSRSGEEHLKEAGEESWWDGPVQGSWWQHLHHSLNWEKHLKMDLEDKLQKLIEIQLIK